MEVNPTLFLISVIFSIISGILIILLLAVQSWVLVKLLPEIKKVSANSDKINSIEKDPLKFLNKKQTQSIEIPDPQKTQLQFGIKCGNFNKDHIHTKECFQ